MEVPPIAVGVEETLNETTCSTVAVAMTNVVVVLYVPQVRSFIITSPTVFGVDDDLLSIEIVELPVISKQLIRVRVTGKANWCLWKALSVVEEGW